MRVEAIVKKDGLFIPHPGITFGKQKHILLDISPVSTDEVSEDAFVQAAGMLKKPPLMATHCRSCSQALPSSKYLKESKLIN